MGKIIKRKHIYIKEEDHKLLVTAFGASYSAVQILEACIHQIKTSNYNFLSNQLSKQKDAVSLTEKRIKELSKKGENDGNS